MQCLGPGRVAALVAGLLCATGCAAPVVIESPLPFPGAVRVTAGADEVSGLRWSEMRRLGWSDFAGRPDITSGAAAVTAYVLNYAGECNNDVFSFTVTATFLPDRSWVKPHVLDGTGQASQALQHEQTHFDLGELHARHMRQELRALPHACAMPVDELDAIVQRLLNEDAVIQRRYDRETGHGTNARRQAEWDARVRRDLAATAGRRP
jgi:hypothetical protein